MSEYNELNHLRRLVDRMCRDSAAGALAKELVASNRQLATLRGELEVERAKVTRLREVLAFYAEVNNYNIAKWGLETPADVDAGHRAHAALAESTDTLAQIVEAEKAANQRGLKAMADALDESAEVETYATRL